MPFRVIQGIRVTRPPPRLTRPHYPAPPNKLHRGLPLNILELPPTGTNIQSGPHDPPATPQPNTRPIWTGVQIGLFQSVSSKNSPQGRNFCRNTLRPPEYVVPTGATDRPTGLSQ